MIDILSGLIWIQTRCHSDGILKDLFFGENMKKISADEKKKFPACRVYKHFNLPTWSGGNSVSLAGMAPTDSFVHGVNLPSVTKT